VNLKPGAALLKISVLMMILQVLKMGNYSIGALLYHVTYHRNLIIRFCLTLFYGDGTLGTVTDTGAQPVTHQLRNKPYLSVNDLESPLVTVRNTHTATVAFLLIYLYNVSKHTSLFVYVSKSTLLPGVGL
jgi:hypothetical protein